MTTLYDVPAEALIEAVAAELGDVSAVDPPGWAEFVKTSHGRELPPEQDDFWQRRAASVLRKVAVDGPIGVGSLRTAYGGAVQGSNRYTVRPRGSTDGSGKLIRTILQQIEEAGYVERAEGEGRVVTSEGHSLLDSIAEDVMDDLDDPALERYA
jgi:small subunit ribosomal protein S19e